ncbi:MAG: hypothetical protein M3P30_10535 [Chloroflexota bacterium]|nr:hypothetical protein [Chloroflexota bacterium]
MTLAATLAAPLLLEGAYREQNAKVSQRTEAGPPVPAAIMFADVVEA